MMIVQTSGDVVGMVFSIIACFALQTTEGGQRLSFGFDVLVFEVACR